MADSTDRRHVFYSRTEDNKFLPDWYIENLKKDLDPLQAKRLLYGEWVEIRSDFVYYNYDSIRNYLSKIPYEFKKNLPIDITHDFNIGAGKPMSACVGQYNGTFHVAKDFIIHSARTSEIMEEIAATDIFENYHYFRIFGDQTGKSRDTRSFVNDYEIIEEFLANYKRKDGSYLKYEICVPRKNPPIRERHNFLNAQFYNEKKEINFFVYKDAPTADKGLRLTKLKLGGQYLEDDSDEYQHVTTAIGYWVHYIKKMMLQDKSKQRQL